jgi:hypothetical protein
LTSEPTIGGKVQEALGRPEAIWIVASNAIPIFGVLFLGWPAFSLLLFYWIENVVIGGFNALKIAASGIGKPKALAAFTLFLVPFFIFHYGMFCFVHGVFVLAMFSFSGGAQPALAGVDGVTDVVSVVWTQLETDRDLRLSVLALVGVQAAWFAVLWLGAGKWRDTNPFAQMMEPYGRILVMHLTIFAATIPVLLLGQTWIAVAALAVLKACMELGLADFAPGLDKLKNLPPDKFPDGKD